MKNGIMTIFSILSLILIIFANIPLTRSMDEINEIYFDFNFDVPEISLYENYDQEYQRITLNDCNIYCKNNTTW